MIEANATGPPATAAVESRPAARCLPRETTDAVRHLVQESLTNVRKDAHAATGVTIKARLPPDAPGRLEVSVTDDGRDDAPADLPVYEAADSGSWGWPSACRHSAAA